MITVVLQGVLRQRFGKSFTLAVTSAREAVNALCLIVPDFKDEFLKYDYSIYSTLGKKKVYLQEDELSAQLAVDKIHIVPTLAGSKSNKQKGTGKVILAAVLFFVPGMQDVALYMAIKGIGLLLTPEPPKDVETKDSFTISSENSASGVAVPLAYGETYFDVIPISVEISSSGMNQATNTTPTPPVVGGGFGWTQPEYEYLP